LRFIFSTVVLDDFVSFILGSYTHHDIIPWDDDVDLSVAITNRHQFQSIIKSELSSSYSITIMQINNKRNYDKVFFTWCPPAGKFSWRFPFIDIFYHGQNSTHVWLIGKPSTCPVRRQDVFPLVLRPLGPLWLLAPKEPIAHFESRSMRYIGCYAFPYSHKHERLLYKAVQHANCSKLKFVYPNVERRCTLTECVEYLKLGDKILHMITFTPPYRTFFYAARNASYRPC
jgi:hypothetical protein